MLTTIMDINHHDHHEHQAQDRYNNHDHQDQLDQQVRASVQGPRQSRAAANSRPLQVGRVT